MLIDVLRHGEPVGGARYRGVTDDPLSETGWQQMTDAVNPNPSPPWTHIISSPLKRCADFATQLSDTHQLTLHIEPRFAEIDFGDWEGLSSEQIMQHDAKRLKKYWQDPEHNTPPNGELLSDFESRVLMAWQEMLATEKYGHLLVATHGGVLRIIFSHVLAMPRTTLFNISAPYACLSRFEKPDATTSTQLVFHNGRLP